MMIGANCPFVYGETEQTKQTSKQNKHIVAKTSHRNAPPGRAFSEWWWYKQIAILLWYPTDRGNKLSSTKLNENENKQQEQKNKKH